VTVVSCLPFLRFKCASLLQLINKYTWTEGNRHLSKCRGYPSGSKRRKKQQAKMREEEVAAKSRNIAVTGSEVQRRYFCGTCKRTENQRTWCDRLDLRNDENRSSLTSGAVAEERQDVSSKNTIDEMADAITGSNDISL